MEVMPDPQRKITLPSSGLAEEILEQAQAQPTPASEREKDDRQPGQSNSGETLHLVGFFLGREEYAIEIARVQEVIRTGNWTWVPNAPEHVKGVINLRGRIIPVVDLKVRLGMGDIRVTKDSRIIVVETSGRALGLLVDGVSQVIKMPAGVVEQAPEELSGAEKGYINGVGKMDGRLIILLDFTNVIWKNVKSVRGIADTAAIK
jgi:purine-binding chemotaxis protein CheW